MSMANCDHCISQGSIAGAPWVLVLGSSRHAACRSSTQRCAQFPYPFYARRCNWKEYDTPISPACLIAKPNAKTNPKPNRRRKSTTGMFMANGIRRNGTTQNWKHRCHRSFGGESKACFGQRKGALLRGGGKGWSASLPRRAGSPLHQHNRYDATPRGDAGKGTCDGGG